MEQEHFMSNRTPTPEIGTNWRDNIHDTYASDYSNSDSEEDVYTSHDAVKLSLLKDVHLIKKYCRMNEEYIYSLLEKYVDDPNRVEIVINKIVSESSPIQLLKIRSSVEDSSQNRMLKRNGGFIGSVIDSKRLKSNYDTCLPSNSFEVVDVDQEPSSSGIDESKFCVTIKNMFPDVCKKFLELEYQKIDKSERSVTRFIDTIMLTGNYIKEADSSVMIIYDTRETSSNLSSQKGDVQQVTLHDSSDLFITENCSNHQNERSSLTDNFLATHSSTNSPSESHFRASLNDPLDMFNNSSTNTIDIPQSEEVEPYYPLHDAFITQDKNSTYSLVDNHTDYVQQNGQYDVTIPNGNNLEEVHNEEFSEKTVIYNEENSSDMFNPPADTTFPFLTSFNGFEDSPASSGSQFCNHVRETENTDTITPVIESVISQYKEQDSRNQDIDIEVVPKNVSPHTTTYDDNWGPSRSNSSSFSLNQGASTSKSENLSPEMVISELDVWIEHQTENLIKIFPNNDPSYLREECTKMNGSYEDLNNFVAGKLECNDMPSRADYEKRLDIINLQNKYTKEFNIKEFLKAIPEPWKYFERKDRNCEKHKTHSSNYLKTYFRKHYIKTIEKAFERNSYNLYLTYKELLNTKQQRATKRTEHKCTMGRPTNIDIQFLQEVAFIENEETIQRYIEAEKEERRKRFEQAKLNGEFMECMCCFDPEVLIDETVYCPQDHNFCKECVKKSTEIEIGNGKATFKCLTNCDSEFQLTVLQNLLDPGVFSKLIQIKQMEEVKAAGIEGLVQCPFCNFATILPPDEKVFVCLNPECLKESCRLCNELSHIPLHCDEVEKSDEVRMRTYIENKMTEALVRTCWKCAKKFVKEDGCNKMTCTCGATMCYICRQPVKDYSHFNGQGGSDVHKCPLYSTNHSLHVDLVKIVGEEAKKEILKVNPDKVLKFDPTTVMPSCKPEEEIPGAVPIPANVLNMMGLPPDVFERPELARNMNPVREHRRRHHHHHRHHHHRPVHERF